MGRRKPIPVEEVERRLQHVHGGLVSLVHETYVGTRKQATFVDADHGTWTAWVSNVLRGHQHPQRGKLNGQKACLEKYGVKTPLAHGKIRERIEQDWLQKYGAKNPLARGTTVRDSVLLTFQTRYGVNNCQQISEVRDRSAKTRRFAVTKKHWKTNEDVVCVGSYERMVVDWLNEHEIDYRWQVPIKIPASAGQELAGRTYFVDLHVVDGDCDLYVEVKGGWPRELQRKKWEWFKSAYTNSELWDQKRLTVLGILKGKH